MTALRYISTGSGKGDAFGLAAVCFVCFPFFFFFRLYWPVAPMTNMIIWVTTALVRQTTLVSPCSQNLTLIKRSLDTRTKIHIFRHHPRQDTALALPG